MKIEEQVRGRLEQAKKELNGYQTRLGSLGNSEFNKDTPENRALVERQVLQLEAEVRSLEWVLGI